MWYHPAAADPEWEVEHVAEATNPEWTDYDIIEWDVYGSLQNMAENGVDSAHFKYIHGAADVPAYEFEWGDNWRAARLFVKMGTPRGTVDGEIAFKNIGPGQSYTRFTGIAKCASVSPSRKRRQRDAAAALPGPLSRTSASSSTRIR
jgi:hypothetical protein